MTWDDRLITHWYWCWIADADAVTMETAGSEAGTSGRCSDSDCVAACAGWAAHTTTHDLFVQSNRWRDWTDRTSLFRPTTNGLLHCGLRPCIDRLPIVWALILMVLLQSDAETYAIRVTTIWDLGRQLLVYNYNATTMKDRNVTVWSAASECPFPAIFPSRSITLEWTHRRINAGILIITISVPPAVSANRNDE